MRLLQAVGPFKKGTKIQFDTPTGDQYRYVKVGVQCPQVPPLSEIENIREDMFSFSIGTGVDNPVFVINANDILEFDDFYRINSFIIIPQQDIDEYGIVEIAFMDEIETE